MSAVYLQQFPSYSNHNCKKIVIFTYPGLHFLFPLRRPCGNHAKRCMNEKTIQCLPNPSQHVPIYLSRKFYTWWTLSVIREVTTWMFYLWHGKTRMAWLPDGEKISKISLFVLVQLTNVTDRQTDGQTPRASNSLSYA